MLCSTPVRTERQNRSQTEKRALCTWLIEIAPERLEINRGYIHPDLVDQIVKKVLQLNSNPQAVEGEQDGESPVS